jgi:hypothetical protein
MKQYKSRYYLIRFKFPKLDLYPQFGLMLNNMHSGNCGFSLYLGYLFIWHQAWFGGELNETAWWQGKFNIKFPFLDIQYSPKQGWIKY